MSDAESTGAQSVAVSAALAAARSAAIERDDPAIGVGHLMLGILAVPEGSGHRALAHSGADLDMIRSKASSGAATKAGDVASDRAEGSIPLTVEAQTAVDEARKEVERMESAQMDTGHLLLAILRNREGVMARALAELDITYDAIDHELGRLR